MKSVPVYHHALCTFILVLSAASHLYHGLAKIATQSENKH